MKILIVDDDEINRKVLQKMLIPYGECDAAVNGIEAIEAFKAAYREDQLYDLIFLDIMMPEMDGREALKKIREMETDLEIPLVDEAKIIMVTALDDPKELFHAYKHNCASYIVKPYTREQIDSAIKEINFAS